jgi:hypothetical protein
LKWVLTATVGAVPAFIAAGCGSSGQHHAAAAAATTSRSSAPCKLAGAQRRGVARAVADIRRLQRIEASMQTFSERGATRQEQLTGKFLLDLGSAHLPVEEFPPLLHQAKAAVRLCGDCSTGLETEEPVLGNRGLNHGRCG